MTTPQPPPDDDRLDALLRAATRRGGDPEPDDDPDARETVDDGALRAWRTGALDETGTAAIDAALAASPEDRALARSIARDAGPDAALYTWAEAQGPQVKARPLTRWAGVLLAAAVLVAAGVTLFGRRGVAPDDYHASALIGGVAELRGEEEPSAEVPVFVAEGRLIVRLRPDAAREAPPVRAFVARPGGALGAVPVQVTPAPGGAMQVEFAPSVLGREYGEWRLYLALGAPDVAVEGRPYAEAKDDGAQWFEFAWRFAPDEGAP